MAGMFFFGAVTALCLLSVIISANEGESAFAFFAAVVCCFIVVLVCAVAVWPTDKQPVCLVEEVVP